MSEEIEAFPVYRKYTNGQSYFKVTDKDHFEEIKKMPKGYVIYSFEAKILPDRNFINDMLYDYQDHWQSISEKEYEAIRILSTD